MSRTKPALVLTLVAVNATIGNLSAQEDLPVWTVDPAPELRIGVVEGLDSEMFVRVADAALLPDHGIVVLDAGAREVRFYDANGAFVASAGREGEGPGEFVAPFALEVRGDSVLVWDDRRRTIAAWSFAGDLLGERIVPHHQTHHEGDLLRDGSLLIPRYLAWGPADRPASGTYRTPAELVLYADGAIQELGPFPYIENQAGEMMGVPVPFGSRSSAAGGGTPLRIFVTGDTREPAVREFDAAGDLVRTIELIDVRERLGDAEWSAILDTLPVMRGREQEIRRVRDDMDLPDRTPWVDRLVVDSGGRLWAVSRGASGTRFAVVYEDGRPVARVDLPDVARLLEIGTDGMVALERDALDVETVTLYRIGRQ